VISIDCLGGSAINAKKSIVSLRGLAACVLVLSFAASCAGSSSTKPAATSTELAVAASGKLAKGAEGSCRVLHGDDGKDYSFASSSIDARFKDGDHVCVTGSAAMGFCMQGTQVELQTMESCR
jgi:hypothetical protein